MKMKIWTRHAKAIVEMLKRTRGHWYEALRYAYLPKNANEIVVSDGVSTLIVANVKENDDLPGMFTLEAFKLALEIAKAKEASWILLKLEPFTDDSGAERLLQRCGDGDGGIEFVPPKPKPVYYHCQKSSRFIRES